MGVVATYKGSVVSTEKFIGSDGRSFLPAQERDFILELETLSAQVPLADLRVHDAVDQRLPGTGNVESAINVSFLYGELAPPTDMIGFVATRAYRVVGITVRPLVAGTDAGAVTATVKKAASGTAVSAGTLLHSGTADLKGTIDTNQVLTLSATSTDLDIPSGTAIGLDVTGTTTAARGVVTLLLAPAGSPDDLRLAGNTFGTNSIYVTAGDLKAAGATTRYARFQTKMKDSYVTGQAISVVINAGMLTTIADGSCEVDVEAYLLDGDTTVTGDKCETAATSMNSVTFAEKSFTITPTGITANDYLDIRVAITCNDGATGTVVEPAIDNIRISQGCKGG